MFRTPIGFHDAYVAAPSMKAALAAWGADSNLFAQGIAEPVTDPELMAEPLARPGEVVRVARGNAGEHLKAVGARQRPSTASRSPSPSKLGEEKRPPKPDRGEADAAEEAVKELDRAHRAELREIERAMAELERRRRQAERRHAADREEAVARRDKAQRAYDRAMKAWRAQDNITK